MVEAKGLADQWVIDSAALGDWHVGQGPYESAMKVLKAHGVKTDHIVRTITKDDFRKFDVIFGKDHENIKELNKLKPKDGTAEIKMLGEYDPKKELIIEDPYYGTYKDFETVYDQCERCCKAYLDAMS